MPKQPARNSGFNLSNFGQKWSGRYGKGLKKIKRRHKLVSTAGVTILAAFAIFFLAQRGFPPVPLPDRVPKHPTDPGRLSLIQVEKSKGKDQIVNQRDGSLAITQNVTIVEGRTPQRKAINIPFINGAVRIPIQDNFDYVNGSVAFWINTDVWVDDKAHLFFAVEALPRRNFGVFKHPDGQGIDILRGGIDPDLITIVSEGITPNVWHHIVLTYSAGELTRLYFDGELVGTSAEPYPGDAVPATAGNCFELICWGTSLFFTSGAQSILEDMQTFNYPLSAAQVLELSNSKFPASFYELGPQ